jgi:hypothetical protein
VIVFQIEDEGVIEAFDVIDGLIMDATDAKRVGLGMILDVL